MSQHCLTDISHIPCLLYICVESFSYTSHTGLKKKTILHISCISHSGVIFIWGVSLTHPKLAFVGSPDTSASFLCGEFLLHIPCWLHFYLGSFSYTSRAVLILMKEFLFHIPCSFLFFIFFYLGSFSYTPLAGFIFIWGVSLTHPVLALFLSGEFHINIPCWIYISVGCFSYTSHAGFFF